MWLYYNEMESQLLATIANILKKLGAAVVPL